MKYVPNSVSTRVARTALLTQKHSPTILFVGGIIGVGATVVTACRATLKVEQLLEDHQKTANDIRNIDHVDYNDGERKHDMAILYFRTTSRLAKLYGPSFILGVTSVGMLAGSHNILNKRMAGVTAAYAALDKGFKDYRARVVDELGEDKDREFRYGVVEREIETVNSEGKKKTKKVKTVGDGGGSIYAKFFEESNPNWSSQPEFNLLFLRAAQKVLNDNLESNGHVFLNEVYDHLGLDRTPAGSQVGWFSEKALKRKGLNGDGYIDFGIWDGANMDRFYDFVVGNEGGIWLDFNVDGVIWNMI